MILVFFLRFYLGQTQFAEMVKKRDCRQPVRKLLLGDRLISSVHDFNLKSGESLPGTSWLGLGLADMGVPCLFWWQCSGFVSTTSVVGSFTFPLSQCPPSDPSGQPGCHSERHCNQDEEALLGLLLHKVPLTCRQENKVNPIVLLLCRKGKPTSRSLALPPFTITTAISKSAQSLPSPQSAGLTQPRAGLSQEG